MTAALVGAAAIVSFSGTVLPHQATDGRVYSLSEAEQSEIVNAMKACRIGDYSNSSSAVFQFAVTDTRDADCVRAHLPASARVASTTNWSN